MGGSVDLLVNPARVRAFLVLLVGIIILTGPIWVCVLVFMDNLFSASHSGG